MYKKAYGFTIVELLIVIVIIAILAAVSIVSYVGIQNRAIASILKADLHNAASQLGIEKAQNDVYPVSAASIVKSADTTFQYTREDDTTYCLSATSAKSSTLAYFVTNTDTTPREGVCPIGNGVFIQNVTNANCPSNRTRAVDARDNRTYWVQKLADGKCWMLTNLAYAGGGTNTYGDVKVLQNGSSDTVTTYTSPKYYVPSGANPTIDPAAPSSSSTGTGQYGYLYNWCGAMGGQVSTSACMSSATPLPSLTTSVCPAGWRLPTGDTSGEYNVLNTAINSGSTTSNSGLLSTWLGQAGGRWDGSFVLQGSNSYYWSASQVSFNYAYSFYFNGGTVMTARSDVDKTTGYAVRCTVL